MRWQNVALGEIFDFSNGVNFDKSAYGTGVKLIGVSNFGNRFSPDFDELQEIDEAVVRTNDYLSCGDIVFVRSNGNKELVGRCMLISEVISPVTYSGFCIRARMKNNRHDPRFFTYYFKTQRFRKVISGSAVGSNIQNLSQGRLVQHMACVPDLSVQRRIADILSAYDDLIENNQKQIKLLEEAAQRLYREWFVELRFPGHETVPVADGVPEGWERVTVGSCLDKVERTKQVMTADLLAVGAIPVVDQSRDFVAGYTNDWDTVMNLDRPVIVFGDHTRVLKYIQFPFAKGADGTQLLVTNNQKMPQSLLYCSLVNVDLSNHHYARHFKYLKAEEILMPLLPIAEAFDGITQPLFTQVQTLRDQCTLAAEARDRLLPKLMSGEVEV